MMAIDESTAMAVLAWKRFDDVVDDRLTRAVAGAFAVIACSDGDLAAEEVEAFVAFAREHEAFESIDRAALERAFRALCEAIFTDLEVGKARALEEVAAVKENEEHARLIVRAGKIALAADHKESRPEKEALELLARTVGLTPFDLR